MSDVLSWLAARRGDVPDGLRERIEEAAAAAQQRAPPDADRAAVLADAGLEQLRVALAIGPDRAVALDLLAADALLTYACEAAAELGDDALARLQTQLAPERFAALLSDGG